eukprot:scaffold24531_cov26-Tisochrysis_lutea.AAC.1
MTDRLHRSRLFLLAEDFNPSTAMGRSRDKLNRFVKSATIDLSSSPTPPPSIARNASRVRRRSPS